MILGDGTTRAPGAEPAFAAACWCLAVRLLWWRDRRADDMTYKLYIALGGVVLPLASLLTLRAPDCPYAGL